MAKKISKNLTAKEKRSLKKWNYSKITKCPKCKNNTLVHYEEQGFLPKVNKCIRCGHVGDVK